MSITPTIDPSQAGSLSRGIASLIPLVAEPAGDWLESASDPEVVALAAVCPTDPPHAWFSVFSHEVLPYQGVFLDPKSGQGWTEPRRIRGWLRTGPHSALSTGRTDDHVITLLEYACWLLNQCRSQDPEPHLVRLRELLDEHLLRWVPALAASLSLHDGVNSSHETTFYARVGRLLTRRLCEVRRHLGPVVSEPQASKTSPSDVLYRDLLIPARCGIWLSRRVLATLCVELGEAPRGERHAVSKQVLGRPNYGPILVRELEKIAVWYRALGKELPEVAATCANWCKLVQATMSRLH